MVTDACPQVTCVPPVPNLFYGFLIFCRQSGHEENNPAFNPSRGPEMQQQRSRSFVDECALCVCMHVWDDVSDQPGRCTSCLKIFMFPLLLRDLSMRRRGGVGMQLGWRGWERKWFDCRPELQDWPSPSPDKAVPNLLSKIMTLTPRHKEGRKLNQDVGVDFLC